MSKLGQDLKKDENVFYSDRERLAFFLRIIKLFSYFKFCFVFLIHYFHGTLSRLDFLSVRKFEVD